LFLGIFYARYILIGVKTVHDTKRSFDNWFTGFFAQRRQVHKTTDFILEKNAEVFFDYRPEYIKKPSPDIDILESVNRQAMLF
jgi:hypothetical protein